MSEVFFYHLTKSTLEDVFPLLVDRSLQRGWRVSVQFMTKERRDAMDILLWTWSDASFIAHGTENDKWPEKQPVFLTTGDTNPNNSEVRFCLEGTFCHDPECYHRIVILFDGHEESQVSVARRHWKEMKEKGLSLIYWQQTPNRKWEKKFVEAPCINR